MQIKKKLYITSFQVRLNGRDGNGAGWRRVSLSHPRPGRKKSSTSSYSNPTDIKFLSHLHSYRVAGIISNPYLYPFAYYFNINFN